MKPPKIENNKFFELLKKKQIIPEDFIHDLLEELDGNALDVLATLIQSGVGTKRQLCQLWCDSIGIAHVDLEKSLFQSHVVRKIPERFARQFYAIPVYQLGDTITVATATPDNEEIKSEIQKVLGNPVNLVFALPHDIEWAIENEYQTSSNLYEFFSKIKTSRIFQTDSPITETTLFEIAGKEAVNQLHVSLVLFGITESASEIQIDPLENGAKVYFVIRGAFQDRLTIDRKVYQRLLVKLKQLAKIDEAQQSEPQYSRIIFPTPGKKFDIQFLSLPTDFGEKIFLKLMDRHPLNKIPSLSEMYLSVHHIHQIKNAMKLEKGLILISGPPKSGKSTLAYSIIEELKNSSDIGIMTIEDNIKWHLDDIDQYQTNPMANFKRLDTLTSCIKMHPRIIYIQSIEDPDLCEPICHAAESEQILFIAGIESSDAFNAWAKSIHLGVQKITKIIINQQFIRRLCDHCKESYNLSPSEIEKRFIWDKKTGVTACREKGCAYCRQSGFSGQIGVQEVLSITDKFPLLINNDKMAPMADIKNAAAQLGFKTKEYDGIKKVLRGLTTFKEIEKITSS